MRSTAIEMITRGEITGRIYVDEEPQSPKDWDNLGTLVTWHRRYCFDQDGQKVFGEPKDFLRRAKAEKWLFIPVGMVDHSGISLYEGTTERAGAVLDSGQVGYLYATRESMGKIGVHPRNVRKVLRQELKTWDDYVTGSVYGYTIETELGEQLDSCWGIYGLDNAKQEMVAALEYAVRGVEDGKRLVESGFAL